MRQNCVFGSLLLVLAIGCSTAGGGDPDATVGGNPDANVPAADAAPAIDSAVAVIDAAPGTPDASVPDASVLDAMVPDAMAPDAMVPDAMVPDAMMFDAPPVVANILLMGEDVDATGWDVFRSALTAAGATWTEQNITTDGFATAVELATYDIVIWFDESVIGPGDTEAQLIVDWLALGGKRLMTASVDFVWDFENGGAGGGEANLYQLMGVTFTADYAGTSITKLDGVVSDPISGDFVAPNGLSLAGNSDSDGDYFSASGATIAGIYGAGGTGTGGGGLSHYDTGTYRMVTLGVNFHNGLTDPAQRNVLMANILTYFTN